VPDARTLAVSVFGGEPSADVSAALVAAGSMVRALENARVLHRDLSAGNILLRSEAGVPEPWVLDLDRCVVLPLGGPPPDRAMRERLVRSLTKLGDGHQRPLTAREWDALRSGWEGHA
jgi:hypothetical protein